MTESLGEFEENFNSYLEAVDKNLSEDGLAKKEALALNDGASLEKDGAKREHQRLQRFREAFNNAVVVLFTIVMFCLGCGVLVFAWHLLTPERWHFLADADKDKLGTILSAALLSSVLSRYTDSRISKT